ncbi:MAG: hypothetical protein OQK35_02525 [Alphaproteobacteria bacterium]|nr:hypothetical protein [Rhodospirillales bacterium]MCW9045184.1 hypothetical protein [Alphaproteobacteria bacterium]
MTFLLYRVLPIALVVGLTGCASSFDLDVPDGKLVKACVIDPRNSYTPEEKIQFASGTTVLGTLTAEFVTNDLVDGSAHILNPAVTKQLLAGYNFVENGVNVEVNLSKAITREGDALWNHPVHQKMLTTYKGLVNQVEMAPIKLSAKEMSDYQSKSKKFALRDGWSIYGITALMQEKGASINIDQLNLQKGVGGLLISAYMDAYFRNGKFIQGKWDIGNPIRKALENLPKEARDKLKRIIPDSKLDEFEKKLNEVTKGEVEKIADVSFVSRGGDKIAIPPISVKFAPSGQKHLTYSGFDAATVGADIVRVTFEALGDMINHIPAVSKATGVISKKLTEKGAQLYDVAKVKLNSTNEPMEIETLGKVEGLATKAHSIVSSSTGTFVRGGSIVALNNESVAKILESIAGTIARKVTERIAWCWYASEKAQKKEGVFAIVEQPPVWRKVSVSFSH